MLRALGNDGKDLQEDKPNQKVQADGSTSA
jgi:hypothetical protein